MKRCKTQDKFLEKVAGFYKDSVLIKTKTGGFFQRKKTAEMSLPVSERPSVINLDDSRPSQPVLEKSKIPSKLVKQQSGISEKSFTLVTDPHRNGNKVSILKQNKNATTLNLKNSLVNKSRENSVPLKTLSPKRSDMVSDIHRGQEGLNFPKFNIQSLNKMNTKSNIFQVGTGNKSETGSPAILQRQASLQKSQLGNTYYLKTQNKNVINANMTAGRFYGQEADGQSPEPANRQQAHASNISPLGKTHGKERSFGFRNPHKESSLETSQNQAGGSVPRKTNSKFNLESLAKNMRRDHSPQQREATYLLNQSNHAFKKARSRPFKNSLLHNVFLNPAK